VPISVAVVLVCFGASAGSVEYEKDGARIRVTVEGSQYKYEVSNAGAASIARFEAGHHNTYNHQVSDGWKFAVDPAKVSVSPADGARAIDQRRTMTLSMRVTSEGAVLGRSSARVELDDGRVIEFEGVWAPQLEPRRTVFLVPITIVCIILAHTWMLARRDRAGTSRAGVT
jgi:hypothetical protein